MANGQHKPRNVGAYQAIIEPYLLAWPKMGLNNQKLENLFYEYPAFDTWKPFIEISLVYAVGTLIKEADLQNPVFFYNLCPFVIKKKSKIKIFFDLPTLIFLTSDTWTQLSFFFGLGVGAD